MSEHLLTTFIRTKNVFKHRLKNLTDYDTVKVYVYELEKLGCNYGPLLWDLKRRGEIWYDNRGNFRALKKGPIDPSLLQRVKRRDRGSAPLTALHLWMRGQLKHVELVGVKKKDIPVYFKAFLDLRSKQLEPFFSVDTFSGRVHTPVVNLKGDLRFKLRFHDEEVVSLDVKQMQPTILAKVLSDSIGSNSFSDTIDDGGDIYVLLQSSAKLNSRPAAKKYLFQLIFGKPTDDIGRIFNGDQHKWVDWINTYKSKTEPMNPHKENPHTNLAWLLQYSEVQVMTEIWSKLKDMGVPFLTIHDEILCKASDEDVVYDTMDNSLQKHFKHFKITVSKG